MELPFHLAIPLLGFYPKNPETPPIPKNLCLTGLHTGQTQESFPTQQTAAVQEGSPFLLSPPLPPPDTELKRA